jgi:hypothetical protein
LEQIKRQQQAYIAVAERAQAARGENAMGDARLQRVLARSLWR